MFLDVYTRFHVSEDIFLVFSYPQRQSIPFQSLRPSGHLSPFSHSAGVERNRERRDRYRSTIHPEVVQGKEASLSAVRPTEFKACRQPLSTPDYYIPCSVRTANVTHPQDKKPSSLVTRSCQIVTAGCVVFN
ncbi:hypothetical protein FOXG_18623 [Fusarium oxysporum f. sp. lycopersici 4287]|uniref:Uncharacterized protein n=2 Tax=Fusarium oxysporum TaxID=5507 RepID=A0A0J9WJA4_FUSO4|nr:hypothetical protein FOXG_18623 [Fusarium oxysporum f. sp. lycopersici 4287]EXK31475.1 hypothetical protein FOMG_13141 [Fusarium oxysporum f. sp. melonis 26406]KNA99936.1 hypothetical protein FOXG_18623 [Fusarium oxysporum f. sp. lycopersici 4287]